MTCARSGQTSLFDLISFVEASPVRMFPARDAAKALLEIARVSGVSLLALSQSFAPAGSLSKTLRVAQLYGSTRWSERWSSSAMRVFRYRSARVISALFISARGSSLLPTLQTNPTIYNRRRGVVYPGLLPTLTTSMGSGNRGGENRDGPFRPSLVEMARTGDSTSLSLGPGELMPSSSPYPDSEPLSVDGLLPTLTASSASRGSCPGEARRRTPNLETRLKLLPTMTRRDDKGPGTRRSGAADLPAAIGGHLNPEWCLWFMGFPAGWLDVDDAHVFARSATPSSRNKPKSSAG